MKVCAFILVSFKNAIDCIMIDSPLKDKIPEVSAREVLLGIIESSFAPLVTSKMP